jgi:predicted ATPase/class 3 adenylate cyclase
MKSLPTGTVTFLFTDIEGSTRLVQELGDEWARVIGEHDRMLREAVEGHGGSVVRFIGDAVFAVFSSPVDAVGAAVAGQQALVAHEFPGGAPIPVRMGLHTGIGALGGADYVGIDVHRAARVSAAAHGGQIVLSEATAPLVERSLPDGSHLVDLGKHRLKDLAEAETLFQVAVTGLRQDFPPLHTLELVNHNLPVQVTSFVGRSEEIAAALRLLSGSRIVTLLGPGGTGKSRLALQVAAEAAEDFGDGVFFVPLASVTDPELIPSAILGAMGVSASSGRRSPAEHVLTFLRDKEVLLILDNFEHLVGGAGLVGDIARGSPGSKLLVTSRVPLHVSGEQEMPVPPMAIAAPDPTAEAAASVDAVRLFVERAAAVDPGFTLTDGNAPAVLELVRRLDGLPLAIELVVPRLRVLPVEGILERLDLRALSAGARDLPERHRTLWNAIVWSYESLAPIPQNLFRHLSVFKGGARLEEIEFVCNFRELGLDLLDGLSVLIENSLVRRSDRAGGTRFEMLTVIREEARYLLAETGDEALLEDRHAHAYLALAESIAPQLLGKDRRARLGAMAADQDNLRLAMDYFVRCGLVEEALRLAWAMWRFWQIKGQTHEARRRLDVVLALEGGSAHSRAKAMEASAGIAWWQGDLVLARSLYIEALQIHRTMDDQREIANGLYNLGLTEAFGGGEPAAAFAAIEEAMQIYETLGDRGGLGDVRWAMGNFIIYRDSNAEGSLDHFRAAIVDYAAAGNLFGEGWAHFELGSALYRLNRLDEALVELRRGIELLYGSGDDSAVVMFTLVFAAVAFARGEIERAYRLAGAGWALRDRSGIDLISLDINQIPGLDLASLEALTGAERSAYLAGRSLPTSQAVGLALGSP